MEKTASPDSGKNDEAKLWIDYLNRVMELDPVKNRVAGIILDALQSANASQAWAAHRINDYYQDAYVLSGKDTTHFLIHLYFLIFDVAKYIPHDGPLQGVLVQLLVELRHLPERRFVVDGAEFLMYTMEPTFPMIMGDFIRSCRPTGSVAAHSADLQSQCEMWINISAFNARCIQSGLRGLFDDIWRYGLEEISSGLEENHPVGVMQNCMVTGAAQYILLAGSKIHHKLVAEQNEGSESKELGLGKWLLWMERLEEVADNEDLEPELRHVAREAHDKVASLHRSGIAEANGPGFTRVLSVIIGCAAILWVFYRSFLHSSPGVAGQ